MAAPVKVEITGDAKSLFAALEKSTEGLKGFAKDVNAMSAGMSGMFKSLTAPLTAIVGLVGGGAFLKGTITETKDWTVESGKLARTLGITTEQASVLNLAIGDIYGNMDEFLPVVAKLTKTLNTNEDAFKKLGVATRDNQGHLRPTMAIMAEVNTKLMEMKSGTDRNVASAQIYGKGWLEVQRYLGLTTEVMKAAQEKAERLNLIVGQDSVAATKAYRESMNEFEDTVKALKVRIGNELMPVMTGLNNWLANSAPEALRILKDLISEITQFFGNFAVQVGIASFALRSVLLPAITQAVEAMRVYALTVMIAGPIQGTIVAIQALGRAMVGMANFWVISGAAIFAAAYGLSTWAQSYSRAGSEMAEKNREMAEASARSAKEFYSQEQALLRIDRTVRTTTAGSKAHRDASEALRQTLKSMIEIYPEFLNYLKKENGEYVNLSGSIERFNRAKIRDLELKIQDEMRAIDMAKEDRSDALKRNILSYALVYKGVADNAERELKAREATLKALQKQIDAIKGLSNDPSGNHADTDSGREAKDKEIAVQKAIQAERLKHLQKMSAIETADILRGQEERRKNGDWVIKEMEDLEKRKEEQQKRDEEQARNIVGYDWISGMTQGLNEYLIRSQDEFQNWKNAVTDVIHGVQGAFSSTFSGILSGQMTFAQGLRNLWQGITQAIVGALAQMAAQWVTTQLVTAVMEKTTRKGQIEGDIASMTGSASLFAAETMASVGWIPYIGPALAAAQIAAGEAILAPFFASATAAMAFAQGGVIDRPTLALMGEVPGSKEVVMPENTARQWLQNLTANVLGSQRQVQGYQRQGASYAAAPRAAAGQSVAQLNVHLPNAVLLDGSQRGLRRMGGLVIDGARAKAREIGQVLVPGQVFGGI